MITVKRYNTISVLPDKMQIVETDIKTSEDTGAYCVDTSHFVPKADAVQVLRAGDISNSGAYDFPDGKDTGVKMPSSRSHFYTGDIAEASVNVKDAKKAADSAIYDSKEAFAKEKVINDIKTAYGSGGSGETPPSQ